MSCNNCENCNCSGTNKLSREEQFIEKYIDYKKNKKELKELLKYLENEWYGVLDSYNDIQTGKIMKAIEGLIKEEEQNKKIQEKIISEYTEGK